jgi:carbon-monoxide dehydrogenase large subunit
VGEGGAIIGPPTLVNAIADALAPFGEVPLELPLTPVKILELIEGRSLTGKLEAASPATAVPIVNAAPTAAASAVLAPAPAALAPATAKPATSAGAAPPTAQPSETSAPLAAGIDGSWNLVLATPMGPQKIVGHFSTDNGVLKGLLESDQGSQSFGGTVAGSRLRWEMKVTKPIPITLKYDLTVEGDKLSGKVKMGLFGSANLTGERA